MPKNPLTLSDIISEFLSSFSFSFPDNTNKRLNYSPWESFLFILSSCILLKTSVHLPLYLSSTSSYAWANSFSCEWFEGSRPGTKPAMVAHKPACEEERGRPADYRSNPFRWCCCCFCCPSGLQLRLPVLPSPSSGVQYKHHGA